MVSTLEIGKKIVELCKQGKNQEAIENLYDQNVVSVEAEAMENMPAEQKGIDAVLKKNQWWMENHEVHDAKVEGPFPHGDRFAIYFNYDVTNKPSGQRMQMNEVGLYSVKNDKVIKEEFFYSF